MKPVGGKDILKTSASMRKYGISIMILFFLNMLRIDAQVSLPRLVRDSMVLQRDARITIWGWASAGEKIKVRFNNMSYKTVTEKNGSWKVFMEPMQAGGPYEMHIDATNHILIKDILLGDVWLCSGQSNIVHQMILHRDRYEQDIATADYPQIRQFWIPTSANLSGPEKDLPTGFWKTANQQDVLQFSVVAFFFARKLYNRYHIPIGLINASVGGPPTQAWISEDGLKEFPVMFNTLTLNKNAAYVDSMIKNNIPDQPVPVSNDKGLTSIVPWFDIKYSPKGWRRINVPGYWEDQGVSDFDGVIWYRKEINIPSSMIGLPSKIVLGRIVDADIVYLNGKPVGQTTYQYPQRRYWLPAGALVAGKNVLVVRVTNNSGKGGFVPDKPYYIVAGRDSIDIKGDWEYKVGQVFLPLPSNRKTAFSAQNNPSALYNAMVAPLTNYTISGFLWYQGESNTENPKEYGALMHALIGDWRKKWGQGNIPFLFVQLPNFSDVRYIPEESQWAATRQVQLNTMSIPNTGMAVTIDLGEWNDIHPDRKKEIGERLALWAEKLKYADTSVVVSGPLYQSSGIEGNKIRVRFSSTGSGLINRDGEELSDFEIAGSDRKFVWAKAKIVGDDVIVWNDSVSSPLYVRYAWADNPDDPNLYNKNGLPASPFESKIE